MIGEGLGEWFEAPSYEEGVGVDGSLAGESLLYSRPLSRDSKSLRQRMNSQKM